MNRLFFALKRVEMKRAAALCYRDVSMYKEAGDVYAKHGWSLYEIAADFILKYKQEIKNKTFRHVARQIKDHYHSRAISYGEYDEAVDMYKRLIDDNNEDDISETLELDLICMQN
ncbi:unnamed protein product [Rhizophagus irregularis]|nr:unnamed protein product [Rhizophagus irregularis]